MKPQTSKISFCLTAISKMKENFIELIIILPFSIRQIDSPFLHTKIMIMSSNEHFRQKNGPISEISSILFF